MYMIEYCELCVSIDKFYLVKFKHKNKYIHRYTYIRKRTISYRHQKMTHETPCVSIVSQVPLIRLTLFHVILNVCM